jgi:hypothetical protein
MNTIENTATRSISGAITNKFLTYNLNDEITIFIIKDKEIFSTLAQIKEIKDKTYLRKKFTCGVDPHDDKQLSLILGDKKILAFIDQNPNIIDKKYQNYILDNNRILDVVFYIEESEFYNNSDMFIELFKKIEFIKQ